MVTATLGVSRHPVHLPVIIWTTVHITLQMSAAVVAGTSSLIISGAAQKKVLRWMLSLSFVLVFASADVAL